MKTKYIIIPLVILSLFGVQLETAFASEKVALPIGKQEVEEGNTWMTLEDDAKHFTCPVCDMHHTLEEAKASTVVEGKKYFLCHPAEQAKLRAGASVYLGDHFFVPGNLYSRTHDGATFKDPVNGEIAALNASTIFLSMGHVRYFFTSENTKQQYEQEHVKTSE